MKGTFSSPKIALDTKALTNSVAGDAVNSVLKKLGVKSGSSDSKQGNDSIVVSDDDVKKAEDAIKKAAKKFFGK